jgi:hypothetical protein
MADGIVPHWSSHIDGAPERTRGAYVCRIDGQLRAAVSHNATHSSQWRMARDSFFSVSAAHKSNPQGFAIAPQGLADLSCERALDLPLEHCLGAGN